MKASGGLWHYIKPYKIFLPYLVPRRSLTNQLCLVVMLGGLVKDRILNVLTPRQVGIVTSKLSIAQNTGNVPWMELLIWLLLRWLPSQCAFGFIESVARNRYDVYLQAQLDTAAMDHVLHLSMNFHDDADAQEIKQAVSQGSGVTE